MVSSRHDPSVRPHPPLMSTADAPLVTVLVTFYNLGPLVAETLDTVLAQT